MPNNDPATPDQLYVAALENERDHYRSEANRLRAVAHHMIEAGRAHLDALAAMVDYDPDRVK